MEFLAAFFELMNAIAEENTERLEAWIADAIDCFRVKMKRLLTIAVFALLLGLGLNAITEQTWPLWLGVCTDLVLSAYILIDRQTLEVSKFALGVDATIDLLDSVKPPITPKKLKALITLNVDWSRVKGLRTVLLLKHAVFCLALLGCSIQLVFTVVSIREHFSIFLKIVILGVLYTLTLAPKKYAQRLFVFRTIFLAAIIWFGIQFLSEATYRAAENSYRWLENTDFGAAPWMVIAIVLLVIVSIFGEKPKQNAVVSTVQKETSHDGHHNNDQTTQTTATTYTLVIPHKYTRLIKVLCYLVLTIGIWQSWLWVVNYFWPSETTQMEYTAANKEKLRQKNAKIIKKFRKSLKKAETPQEIMRAGRNAAVELDEFQAAYDRNEQFLRYGEGCNTGTVTHGTEKHRTFIGEFRNCGSSVKYLVYDRFRPVTFKVKFLDKNGTAFTPSRPINELIERGSDEVTVNCKGNVCKTDGPFYVYSSSEELHHVQLTPIDNPPKTKTESQ